MMFFLEKDSNCGVVKCDACHVGPANPLDGCAARVRVCVDATVDGGVSADCFAAMNLSCCQSLPRTWCLADRTNRLNV